eukprot:2632759-Rhodomonas_salina.3
MKHSALARSDRSWSPLDKDSIATMWAAGCEIPEDSPHSLWQQGHSETSLLDNSHSCSETIEILFHMFRPGTARTPDQPRCTKTRCGTSVGLSPSGSARRYRPLLRRSSCGIGRMCIASRSSQPLPRTAPCLKMALAHFEEGDYRCPKAILHEMAPPSARSEKK